MGSTCETAFANTSATVYQKGTAAMDLADDTKYLDNYNPIHKAHEDCDRSYMQNEDFTWSWCEHKLTKDGGAYACFRKPETAGAEMPQPVHYAVMDGQPQLPPVAAS